MKIKREWKRRGRMALNLFLAVALFVNMFGATAFATTDVRGGGSGRD